MLVQCHVGHDHAREVRVHDRHEMAWGFLLREGEPKGPMKWGLKA
jgi:hypothetical protein